MNAAARLLHQRTLSRHLVLGHWLNRQQIIALFLGIALLISALSVIYVTHSTRMLHAIYQRNIVELGQLQVQQDQLLLERSHWMTQSRIQQVAEKQLGMVIPDHHSVVIIRK